MKVLWLPIFSMRSYETGQYSILKDGNFQLTLARAFASDFTSITIGIPNDASDAEELLKKYEYEIAGGKIAFVPFTYGENAVETRRAFWNANHTVLGVAATEFDLLITDITGYTGDLPMICNFNITKLPELERPYIDAFFETDLDSIERSLFTTVLNPRQREYILEVRPELISKVIVNTKCASEYFLPKHVVRMSENNRIIFWPFRISDKAYKWAEFCEAFEDLGMADDFEVIVTDPNDSLVNLPKWASKVKPTKDEYYLILAGKPIIVMLDDIDTVLHPGTIEFFHYGCPVIAFSADLIQNVNAIDNLSQIAPAAYYPVYNGTPDIDRFVYKRDELDQFYNETFANVNLF